MSLVSNTGTLTVTDNNWPLQVNGRNLQRPDGTPFLITGETMWDLMVSSPSLSQIDAYIADRQAKGFNAVMVMLIDRWINFPPDNPNGTNINGDAPFTTTPWLVPANINPAYWSYTDSIMAKFRAANMLVLLAGCYSGYGPTNHGEGWWNYLTSNSVANTWGQWVGARYNATDWPNIIWVGGGDYTPANSTEDTLSENIQTGIVAGGGTQLQTYHTARYTTAMAHWGTGKSWLKVGDVYCDIGTTNGSPYTIPEMSVVEYNRGTPTFLIEDWYTEDHGLTYTQNINEKYQALLSGCTSGALFANVTIWQWLSGYQAQWGNDESVGFGKAGQLLRMYDWWNRVPRQDSSFISSSLGAQGPDRICPCIGTYSGGNYALVSIPTATSVTVVMTNFSQSSVRARWYDPKTGNFTNVTGQPFANTGSRTIAHPGNNSMGTSLQILVMD